MWRNYIKTGFRAIVKQRFYAFINIVGLAIGIATTILIALYIIDELSYDKHHSKAENIYRLVNVYDFEGVGENSASAPFPVAFTLQNEYPGMIKNVVRVFNRQASITFIEVGLKGFNERRFFFADSTYFQIFDHNFIYGDPETALREQRSVVITESTAKRYFGDKNPIGQTIKFEKRTDLKVTAVIEDVPDQSHFKFDLLSSMSTVRLIYGGRLPQTWVWNPCWTYFVLEPGSKDIIEAGFPDYINKYFYDAERDNISMYFQPLLDIHLKSRLDYEIEANSNIKYINILAIIAAFLLIIAIINYINLATATSGNRSREIGIKKVVGVNRIQLVFQFLGESFIITLMGMLLALIMVELILPAFNTMTVKSISLASLLIPNSLLGFILVIVFIGIASGLYPAVYLSSFKPITAIRSSSRPSGRKGIARKTLVILQFTISITLIIATLTIFRQLDYLRNADLGFEKENVVLVPVSGTSIASKFDSFKKELKQNPNVINVTAMDDILGASHNTHEFRPDGFPEDQWQFYPALVTRYDFVKTFGIKMLAGRAYEKEFKTDPVDGIIINEAMVHHLGWESPEKAIGRKLRSLTGNERVIGVTENFNAISLHESAGPFVLNIKETAFQIVFFLKYAVIRISEENQKETLLYIENTFKDFEKGRPFEYTFHSDELDNLYRDEENLGTLSLVLTILIIFIATLGLLGLSAFMAEQRTKEIGIRKVVGARSIDIVKIISVEFMKLISIAVLLAWPVSWWLISDWLSHFHYKSSIHPTDFVLSGLIAMILALVVTGIRAMIASRTNPVDTLKHD